MQFCSIYCGISLMFIIGMIYFTFSIDKTSVSSKFKSTLNSNQLNIYQNIVDYRKNLFLQGYGLGFIISMVVIILKLINKISLNSITIACLVGSICFTTSYFYYILSPKPDYMIMHIEGEKQKTEWLNIYKTMQFHYHFGLLLGIIGVILLSLAFCK